MKPMKYNYDITEVLGIVSPTEEEQEHLSWCKAVLETLLTDTGNGTKSPGIDIRKYNHRTNQLGDRGIRLTKEEANRMVNILLQKGYGDFAVLEEEYRKRMNVFQEEGRMVP